MEMLVRALSHPDELLAYVRFKVYQTTKKQSKDEVEMRESLRQCYQYLNQTSRSFSAVIQELDIDLRHAVCIFYLVLRALDTLEDDMTITRAGKVPLLRDFHTYLYMETWRFTESQEKDRVVLEDFPSISKEFRLLSPVYQSVIRDICAKMGRGMALYLEREIETYTDWDEYCHYVAGLVGVGLSRLFAASELEDASIGEDEKLANSMGQFLQKTNIIRDFLEDYEEGRVFWPRVVWSKYSEDLSCFTQAQGHSGAGSPGITCLNELITNALTHIPDVITYLSRLRNTSIFNFCAIPQVMAISTLELCYANPSLFEGVVKLRRGETLKLILQATDIGSVKKIFSRSCHNIQSRVSEKDANCLLTKRIVYNALASCTPIIRPLPNIYIPLAICFLCVLFYIIFYN